MACELAAFYGVTLDDLVNSELCVEELPAPVFRHSHLVISLLAGSVVWLIATIVFAYGVILHGVSPWLSFVWAVPGTCVVALVFNTLFGNRRQNYLILSFFTWLLLAAVYFTYLQYQLWVIYIVGLPVQTCIILWSKLKRRVPFGKSSPRSDGNSD